MHPAAGSQHTEGRNDGIREILILLDSAEFARWLAPLAQVDKLDGARVSEQVKSHN